MVVNISPANGMQMASPKPYDWRAMGTSPAEILTSLPSWVIGGGSVPEAIRWNASPQGSDFWIAAFLFGSKNAESALARMHRQAERDFQLENPVVYNIAAIGGPDPIVRLASWLRGAQTREPYAGVHWHRTPQGAEYWKRYFRTSPSTRDPLVLEKLIEAAIRAGKLGRLK